VTGTSKGKGFAGGVKRHHFKGGPRTHGQSDRERAPGSIGQTTTPGRVYKGKRMAGKMGNDTVTVKNLEIVDVRADGVLIKGLVPGIKGAYIVITKVGKNKKAVPMLKEEVKTDVPEAKEVTSETGELTPAAVPAEEAKESVQAETKTEEVKTEEK
ncbi:MAG: 50S ribosomal protein L3, partial [Patescibacteria group bacterium]|nr:50S ribosomal protein L3 [Patescibacteria group bacterium]